MLPPSTRGVESVHFRTLPLIPTETNTEGWASSWPDAAAFAIGLAVAWYARWSASDLVWSLWLSSLVVGYATILWMIVQPASEFCRVAWRDRALFSGNFGAMVGFALLLVVGVGFFLGFFTIHFGGFHYVHSQFLISFFPIDAGHGPATRADAAIYAEVARRYWPFLPSAFIAHRAAFLRKPFSIGPETPLSRMGDGRKFGSVFSEPYRNVVRMHLLIFFFFFAHLARLENFVVYAVIYAAYFFPWRLVRRVPVTPTIELRRAD